MRAHGWRGQAALSPARLPALPCRAPAPAHCSASRQNLPTPLLSIAPGKSCLLDVLAARKTAGALDPASEVLYGGRRPTPDFLRANLGYLEQADTLLPNLTGELGIGPPCPLGSPAHVLRWALAAGLFPAAMLCLHS